MTDLALVSIEELTAEIRKRYDVALIGLVQNKTDDDHHITVFWHGGRLANIGLVEHIKKSLLDDISGFDEEEE